MSELTKSEKYYLQRWQTIYLALRKKFPSLDPNVVAQLAMQVVAEVAKDSRMFKIAKRKKENIKKEASEW